jgi:hypothetical protein
LKPLGAHWISFKNNPEKLLCSASLAAKIVMRSLWN